MEVVLCEMLKFFRQCRANYISLDNLYFGYICFCGFCIQYNKAQKEKLTLFLNIYYQHGIIR